MPIELSQQAKKNQREIKDIGGIELQKMLSLDFYNEEYDRKYPDRKNDVNYARIKSEWIKEQMEETLEKEGDNTSQEDRIQKDKIAIKNLQKKYEEALIDDVTGFRIRRELFKKMDEDLKGLFGCEKDAQLSSEEWIKIIESEQDNFENINLSVMMSDISYLSLVNEGGHKAGDDYLKYISKTAQKHEVDGYRHGGDEITALFYEPKEIFLKRIQDMSEEIRSQKNVANLGDYNLVPNLDIGVAHFSEGLKVFKEILKSDEGRQRILKENALEELKDIWLEIADKRAFLEKGKMRIALLMDLFSDDWENYKEVISFLRKGGYNINDDELERLVTSSKDCDKAQQVKMVKDFIVEKDKQSMLKLGAYKRLKAEIIGKVVGFE